MNARPKTTKPERIIAMMMNWIRPTRVNRLVNASFDAPADAMRWTCGVKTSETVVESDM